MVDSVTRLDGFNVLVNGRDAYYLANENDAYVGRSLIEYGEYGQEEFELLSKLVQAGSYVVEIGANIGAHTVRLAKSVGLSGRVVAFEPQPVVFQTLAGTMSLNSLMNVDCLPYGVGREPGQVMFPAIDYRKPNNFGGLGLTDLPEGANPVRIVTLDEIYAYDRLDFLKIDVEGMELDVLIGAQRCLQKFQPALYVENDIPEKSPELIRHLFDVGYRLWWHLPALFNPDNYFSKSENHFENTRSVNMLGLPKDRAVDIALTEIQSPNEFPAN
jgi:FkbM family methyltransferase